MKEFTDLLTITIPTYERIDFFEEALDSALLQTVKCNIIVVDNGSSHNEFLNIIQKKNCDRISFYKNKQNIGMFGNWNKCVEYAKSEFLMILGDDDILEPDYVAAFLDKYNQNSDLSLYYTNLYLLYGTIVQDHEFKIVNYGWKTGNDIINEGAIHGLSFPLISSCIRKSLFEKEKFPERPHMSGDWYWVYLKLPKSTIVYGNIEKKYYYRKHDKADTAVFSTCIMLISHIYIYQNLAKRLDKEKAIMALDKAKNILVKQLLRNPEKFEEIFITHSLYDNFVSRCVYEYHINNTYCFNLFIKNKFFRCVLKKTIIKKFFCLCSKLKRYQFLKKGSK